MSDGQLAMNTNLASPGLFLKDSNGDLVKVGPVHVGTTAPNATPASGGQAGNSVGEQWLDTSSSRYVFKIWDGTAWRTEDGEFVNSSGDTMTGALGIIAGTDAAPSVFFSGDTNTGIYSPGADQLAISTNGTGRLFVDAGGNVGVGVSSPQHPVHIDGTSGAVQFRAGVTYAGTGLDIKATENSDVTIDVNDSTKTVARALVFSQAGSERMRLDSSGRLGLGTSSPGRTLDIVSSDTWIRTARTSGNAWLIGLGVQDAFRIYDDTAGVDRFRIEATTGRVGIGTTSPAKALEVAVGSSSALRISRSGVSEGDFSIDASGNVVYDAGIGDGHIFRTDGGTERARIDSSGRLLVGTSSAVSSFNYAGGSRTPRFQVLGSSVDDGSLAVIRTATGPVFFMGAGASGTNVVSGNGVGYLSFHGYHTNGYYEGARIAAEVDGTPGSNDMPGRLVFSTTADGASSPTERMRISSAGNVGIGTTPSEKLHVSGGNVYVQNSAGNPCFIDLAANGGAPATSSLTISQESAGVAAFFNRANAAMYFATNGTERARIDSSGRLLIGNSQSQSVENAERLLQVQGTGATTGIQVLRHTAGSAGPVFAFGKTRGSVLNSVTAVIEDDVLGRITFAGANNTDVNSRGAEIGAYVDGEPGTAGDTTDMPGRLVFSTTPDGLSTPTEVLRLTNDNVIAYNQPAPTSKSAAATLTIAELKTGIIQYTGSAATLTLPTGTLSEGGFSGIYTNMAFQWSVINTGSGTCTIGAGTAHTIVGGATIAAGASGRFASRRTASNTFVSYRLS